MKLPEENRKRIQDNALDLIAGLSVLDFDLSILCMRQHRIVTKVIIEGRED